MFEQIRQNLVKRDYQDFTTPFFTEMNMSVYRFTQLNRIVQVELHEEENAVTVISYGRKNVNVPELVFQAKLQMPKLDTVDALISVAEQQAIKSTITAQHVTG